MGILVGTARLIYLHTSLFFVEVGVTIEDPWSVPIFFINRIVNIAFVKRHLNLPF